MWSICPLNHRLGFRLGHGTSGFTLGSGDTRNMDKCPALSMGYSRSRNKCLAGCVLFFPSRAQRFPFWCGYGHYHYYSQHLGSPPAPPWCLELKSQQSKLWSGQADVPLVIILLPLWFLFILLQPRLLIRLILWLVAFYAVPSTELPTYIFLFNPYEDTPISFPLLG